jgi:uncharacterized delta-60 repeat protein
MSRLRWSHLFARKTQPAAGRRRRVRPVVEPLEERTLLTAGTLDPTFNPGSPLPGTVTTDFHSTGTAVAIDQSGGPNNGDIYVAGYATDPSTGLEDFALARYLPTAGQGPGQMPGRLDTSFGNNGEKLINFGDISTNNIPIGLGNAVATSVQVHGDGKIVVGGSVRVGNPANGNFGAGLNNDFAVVRVNSDGSLDNNFGTNGKAVFDFTSLFANRPGDDQLLALGIDGHSRIVAGGTAFDPVSGHYDLALARLDPRGNLDRARPGSPGFGTGGASRPPTSTRP